MAIPITFYKLNDNYLTLPNVRDGITGALLSGATITATLVNAQDIDADGNFLNIPMTETDPEGNPGTYSCTIPASFDAPAGIYSVLYVGSTGDGLHLYMKQRAEVLSREVV